MKLQHKWMRRLLTLVCVLAVCAIALISCDMGKTPDEVVPDNNIPNDSTTSEHEHTLVVDEAIAATCSKEGRTSGVHCSECQEVILAQQIVSKLAHTVVIDEGVPATYEKTGLTTGEHCAICGEILVVQQVIPKLENPGDGGETPDNPGGDVPEFTECPEVHTKANLDALGIKYTEISKHTAESCEDRAYTTYRCDSCKTYFLDDIVLPAAGVKCEWEVTTEATCAAEGVKTCKVCKYEMMIDKDTSPYAHDWEDEVACGDAGQKTNRTCMICGIVEKDVPVRDTHAWTKIEVIEEPTCGVPGKAVYTCTNCNVTRTLEIPAEHNWVYGTAQEGKCFSDGTTQPTITAGYYCADCKVAAEKNQIIIVDGKEVENTTVYSVTEKKHNITVQTSISTSATCTTAGFKFMGCDECGYMTTAEMTPALGHHWERPGNDISDCTLIKTPVLCDATTETVGKYVYTVFCVDCYTDVVIYEEAHTIIKDKYVAPTCTKPGYTCDYCEICNVEFNVNVVAPATNHYYANAYYDCYIGAIVHICTVCEAKPEAEREADWKLLEAIEGFDYNDPAWHIACGGNLTFVAVDARNHAGDCNNDKVTVYMCDKHNSYIVYNEGKQHYIDFFTYEPKFDPTCDTKGQVGYERCELCDYKKGIHSSKGGLIEALGHDWDMTTYVEAFAPTCTTEGSKGYGVCLREDCNRVIGEKRESKRVIPALGHNMIVTVMFAEPTCTTYAYNYSRCIRCDFECWVDYRPATGHNLDYDTVDDMPTCTEKGILYCQNPDCGLGYDENGNLYRYAEEVNKIPHVDMEGNDINCVDVDFYCFDCCAPMFDAATGKFTGSFAKDPIDARESHVDVTTVISSNVCGGYSYKIHICNCCGESWNMGDMVYVDHDTTNAHWTVVSPATPGTPGIKALCCGRCDAILETREYTYGE